MLRDGKFDKITTFISGTSESVGFWTLINCEYCFCKKKVGTSLNCLHVIMDPSCNAALNFNWI